MARVGRKMSLAYSTDGETWKEVDGYLARADMSMSSNMTEVTSFSDRQPKYISGGETVEANFTVIGDALQQFDDAQLMDCAPLYPCSWCGTWKAWKCSCPKCGAPDNL